MATISALPDHMHLPDKDGSFVRNAFEPPQSALLTESIRPVLSVLHPGDRYFIGQDCGIYWRHVEPPERGVKAPDWFYVPNVPALLDDNIRRSYVVTAFGQACAYCLFSHKVYLVISKKAPDDEVARLDALCQVFGLGFVLFDSDNPEDPRFSIRTRPQLQRPDLFYANKYMKLIEAEMFAS